MKQNGQIAMNGASVIEIEGVSGNLRIRGSDTDKIMWRAEGDGNVHLNEDDRDGDLWHIRKYAGNLRLEIPSFAALRIGDVGGSARIKSMENELSIDTVGGELHLRKVGSPGNSSAIGSVGGTIHAKQIAGHLSIDSAGGNISLLDIMGDLRSATAGGHIALGNIQGSIKASAGGNAKLRLKLTDQNEYNISAGHNIYCYMPPETSARVQARSPRLELHWPDIEQTTTDRDRNDVLFQLGDGEASLILAAGHLIELHCQSAGQEGRSAEDFDDHDRHHVDVDFDFDFNLGDFGGFLSEQVQRKVQQAIHHAEEHIASAMRHVEQNIADAEQRITHMSAKWDAEPASRYKEHGRRRRKGRKRHKRKSWSVEAPPQFHPTATATHASGSPSHTAGQPVGDEERMMILKMVEEGKIDVAQAEKLLLALGDSA